MLVGRDVRYSFVFATRLPTGNPGKVFFLEHGPKILHTAIAEQIVNELACGGGGRVHGAKCLATLAGVA